MVLLSSAAVSAETIRLVSNEGQDSSTAVDRVWLSTNPAPPAEPAPPPADEAGLGFATPGYTEAGAWKNALPVWRDGSWPKAGLPQDDSGHVLADWIWSTPLDSGLDALFYPDSDNGTQFPRRYSALRPDAPYGNGYIPDAVDSAAFFRRELCLPLNAENLDTQIDLFADSEADVSADGQHVFDTCDGTPDCAATGEPSYLTPSTQALPLTVGRNALGIAVWSWDKGAVLGGLLYQMTVTYDPAPIDLSVASVAPALDHSVATIQASLAGDVPAGAEVSFLAPDGQAIAPLGALAAGTTAPIDAQTDFLKPGELLTVRVDAADCENRTAGGTVNLLGGTSSGTNGPLAASGVLEETDETNNTAQARLPPALSGSAAPVYTASPSMALTGTSYEGTTVRVWRASDDLVDVQADSSDAFSANVPLTEGDNALFATAEADGVISAPSTTLHVVFDPNPPAAPAIDSPATGTVLYSTSVDAAGTGTPGLRVLLALDGQALASVTVDASGRWTQGFQADPAAHQLDARQESLAGVDSAVATSSFTIENPPDAGTPDGGIEDGGTVAPDGGIEDGGTITPDGGTSDGGTITADGGANTTDGGAAAQQERYGVKGGGGCASVPAGALMLLVVGLALLLRRRRSALLVLLVLVAARAQALGLADQATFAGDVPSVGAATGDRHAGPAVRLDLGYEHDPILVTDAGRHAIGSLVRDEVEARAVVAYSFGRRFALSLSLPGSPVAQSSGALGTFAPAAPGVGDLSLGALVGLVTGPAFRLGLDLSLSAPSATTPLLGTGSFAGGGDLVANASLGRFALALALGAQSAGVAREALVLPAGPQLDLRAGVSVRLGTFTPFATLLASSPFEFPFSAADGPVLAEGGVTLLLPLGLSVTAAAGRGLSTAAGSPAFTAFASLGWKRLPPPATAAVPFVPVPPPTLLKPGDGEVVRLARPTIEGTAEPGARVALVLDGEDLSSVRVDRRGRFRVVPAFDLVPGLHELIATQSTARGVSEACPPRTFLVEKKPPATDRRAQIIAAILRFVRTQTHLTARETAEGVAVSTNVHFDFDSTQIKPSERGKLDELGKVIRAFPALKIRVESHTDNIGTPEYNLGLSLRRATSVRQFLHASERVDEKRVAVEGYGDTRPIASNLTPQGRALNRRFAECVFLVP